MPITYYEVGDNYDIKDPVKKLAQVSAAETAGNLTTHGFTEVRDTRGESAYVWKQGDTYMASVIEGLGTKNIVADAMRKITGKTYYDIIGYETIATIINDLISVGAAPLVAHAYWAVGSNDWFQDTPRLRDLIAGWKEGCDLAGVSWGGGESPTLQTIVHPDCIDLGGSAVGIIKHPTHLLSDQKINSGDRIILLQSTGLNANGISLARAVADRLPNGYATTLSDGTYYGAAVLNKTNIYATLFQKLFSAQVDLHYVSNITGHGLRKIMRGRGNFTYTIEHIFQPTEIFQVIQQYAELPDYEMYQTYNMGMDYALFVGEADVDTVLRIIRDEKFSALDAGSVIAGKRQVIIQPKDIIFSAESLDLRE